MRPETTIFPIIKRPSQNADGWKLVGTGFFIHPSGIFLTAKHVAEDIGRDGRAIICPMTERDGKVSANILRIAYFSCSANSDIAAGSLFEAIDKNSGAQFAFDRCVLTAAFPGDTGDVTTFAHPKTTVENIQNTTEIVFHPYFSDGKILEHFPHSRGGLLKHPCWRTTMRIPGGASGGPVFDKNGRVFAINTTEFEYSDEDRESYVTPITDLFHLSVPDGSLENLALLINHIGPNEIFFEPPLRLNKTETPHETRIEVWSQKA